MEFPKDAISKVLACKDPKLILAFRTLLVEMAVDAGIYGMSDPLDDAIEACDERIKEIERNRRKKT